LESFAKNFLHLLLDISNFFQVFSKPLKNHPNHSFRFAKPASFDGSAKITKAVANS
jgi:hypothetical protein